MGPPSSSISASPPGKPCRRAVYHHRSSSECRQIRPYHLPLNRVAGRNSDPSPNGVGARRISPPSSSLSGGIGVASTDDHGSRRRESNAMLRLLQMSLLLCFKDKTGYPIVEPSHVVWELATPTTKDAFTSCVQQGANRIIVSPFFLLPGRHWYQDIPSLAAEAAQGHSGASYFVTAPLGLHEHMVDVMNDRIVHCLRHIEGGAEECQVCAGTGKCRLRG